MKAVIIPADSNLPARIVEAKMNLDYYQGVVGGLIEGVSIERVLTDTGMKSVEATVYVNEEGKLIGLPVNPRATDLCAVTIGGWIRDVIMGDVIVVGPPDDEGETLPVPENVIEIIREWGWLTEEKRN